MPFRGISTLLPLRGMAGCIQAMATAAADAGVLRFLQQLKDHEKAGVPRNAGTDSEEGFDLGRMQRLVCSLGNPLSSYPAVHVAGTKGKGSTVAFLGNILRSSGYSVGSYTSPHLRSIHERMAVGKPISEQGLENLFRRVQQPLLNTVAAEDWKLTHFEVLTALAFKYFAEEKVDIALIEAGLGGARDATNIIQSEGLAAAVIVSIGEEHLDALGGSLESIALAKAGIIKQNRPAVLSQQRYPAVNRILQNEAIAKNAPIIQPSEDYVRATIKRFDYDVNGCFQVCDFAIARGLKLQHGKCLEKALLLKECKMRMFGYHQVENALTAICAALCLREDGWNIPDSALRTGLEEANLSGRFEVLSKEQVEILGFQSARVVLDGAHTTGSAAALASTLRSLFPTEPLALITAMAMDKDHVGFASALLEANPTAVLATTVNVAGSSLRSASKETVLDAWAMAVAEKAHPCSLPTLKPSDSLDEALEMTKNLLQQHDNGVVCITGSLHGVSAILDMIKKSR